MAANNRRRPAKKATSAPDKVVPPTKITVPHLRPPNLPAAYADGVLVRVTPPNIVLTFYTEDNIVTSEVAKLNEIEGGVVASYKVTHLNEGVARTHRAEIRLSLAAVPGFLGLIRQKTTEAFPDLEKAIDDWSPRSVGRGWAALAAVASEGGEKDGGE